MSNLKQALNILKQTKRCNDNMVADAKEKLAFGEAFDVAIEAVEKQIPISREVVEGKYFCPKCHNLMPYPGFCGCGQRVY